VRLGYASELLDVPVVVMVSVAIPATLVIATGAGGAEAHVGRILRPGRTGSDCCCQCYAAGEASTGRDGDSGSVPGGCSGIKRDGRAAQGEAGRRKRDGIRS
jgi:hypothetical protein